MNQETFEIIKKEAEEFYKTIDPVLCPYLKTEVYFNVKGLDHIKMKS